ncbi:MAG: hypothetical protein A2W93_15765 [Bacteroidetes bacterium GWF2_43_63]|nr:MAG: hypothetical protein A2W94_13625 [Bacteroidetes bacterium GWE2_42_42]OFY53125.1 MAG: hypothetical protein A2W93_15765 [Bacteroidetes bacterium GWF2_43_63]HBG70361.1 hypothetical protein [Bacteroidales bacterium]HCB60592.1 hypothetical protein [Bacteroidales bacterium]HCY22961.1 hypothetical protein [Bacteroidales bacterium]
MKSALLLFFSFWIMSVSFAQNDKHPEIRISSDNALGSKTLLTEFFGKFYFGKYIDSTTKWDELNFLDTDNHLGFFSNNRIEVRLPSKKKYSFYIAGSHQSLFAIGFSKELFQLVFTGNNSLVGQQVIADPATMDKYNFSTLSGGIVYKINDDMKIHAAVGPVAMYSCAGFDFSGSDFFTSQAADSLALNLNGDYMRAGGPTFVKGVGFSSELGIEGSNGGFEWSVSAANIGRVWLNKNTINSHRDTLMYFTGVEVSDLSNFSAVVDQELENFEQGFSLKGDTANSAISLPLLITGECSKETGKLRTDLNVLYYNLPGFFPYMQLRPSWPISTGFRISLPMKYGGYSSFNAGLGLEFVLADHFSVQLDFPSMLSVLNISRNLSYNVTGKIIYKFTNHASLL